MRTSLGLGVQYGCMIPKPNRAGGTGLERLRRRDWIRSTAADGRVEFFEARLHGHPYQRHRHEVYAICLTTAGILAFDYRGSSEVSGPGEIVVLYPDEIHDGYAGSAGVFGYRQVYVDPTAIFEAIRSLSGQVRPLPFVRGAVVKNRRLADSIRSAFESTPEPLALDSLVVRLAEGLMEADPACGPVVRSPRIDVDAVVRAREYL